MKDINKIIFVLHARAESTRVPNKMLRKFADSCLFEIAVEKFSKSLMIPKQNFYASVRNDKLIDIAKKYDANIWYRSEKSIQEPVTPPEVYDWYNMALDKGFSHFVYMNPCTSLVEIETINKFIKQFVMTNSDSLFAVLERKNFTWAIRKDASGNNKLVTLNKFFGHKKYKGTLETKLTETLYEPANCLYAGKISNVPLSKHLGSFTRINDPEFFIMNPIEAFDIDDEWQFTLAEYIYKHKYDEK